MANYEHHVTRPSLQNGRCSSVSSPAEEILHYDLTLINLTLLEYGLESASLSRSYVCSDQIK